MRSLGLKLTLSFLLVSVLGLLLFVLNVGLRTQSEFSRFLSARDQAVLVNALGDYYETHSNWNDVGAYLAGRRPLDFYSRGAVLTNAQGHVVLARAGYAIGNELPRATLDASTPVRLNDQIVGYVLFVPLEGDSPVGAPPLTETAFIGRVVTDVWISAGIAALFALGLGAVLARTLTRPIRELTLATQAMAGGKLDQRVAVRSRDEIGELAKSFNQMSADLAHASQARKQLTADLAHDLRTPLSILRGYTEGLRDGRLQGTPNVYAIMHDEVEQLRHLVEDLRTLSLADAGEMRLNRRTVDPKALLERTALAYFVQAEQQGLTLRVEADEGLPPILIDTERMTQVLNNLVSNALRHTMHGEVVLAATAHQQVVQLKVRDTGTGIAAEDLPYVFERFYRGDKSRQRSEGDSPSSGLGLAIAKAIVEAHGGKIAVESALGRGTTVMIELAQNAKPLTA